MSNGGDLLRMLMPAVRPVSTEGARPSKPPIESQSFDTLLRDARQADAMSQAGPAMQAESTNPAGPAEKAEAPAPLAGLDTVHNASLRRIIAETNGR